MTDTATQYRIAYQIQHRPPGHDDFVEIGFGSTSAWSDLDGCIHELDSAVSRGEWETESGQPDPDVVMRDIAAARMERWA